MEQQAVTETAVALGTITGLVTATTLATQFVKNQLKNWPVPPMALVLGLGLTYLSWGTGLLSIPEIPLEGATTASWLLLGVHAFLKVVLPSMGVSTIISKPAATVKREPTPGA